MSDSTDGGDYLVRAMSKGATLRAMVVRTTGVGAELHGLHDTLPTGAAALVRLATAGLLLGGTIKGREQIAVQIRGDGPLGELLAIADAKGNVRATIDHPRVVLPPRPDGKFNLSLAIGQGTLTIMKSLGNKEPYNSVVPLVTGEIATDLAYYFTTSEQKPAAMGLGELIDERGVQAAGGFLIQAFPAAEEDELARVEDNIASLEPVSDMIASGSTPEEILDRILPSAIPLARYPVQRNCTCSTPRLQSILVALGEAELTSMIEDQGGAELRCHWCNRVEVFSRDQLEALLARAKGQLQ